MVSVGNLLKLSVLSYVYDRGNVFIDGYLVWDSEAVGSVPSQVHPA